MQKPPAPFVKHGAGGFDLKQLPERNCGVTDDSIFPG
jgi:hypothetical protein